MARYNEILVGRFARSVQKLFGMKGEVPVASLAGEILITHAVQSGRENRYLESWRTFGARITAGPVAAQNSAVRLANPAGSNIIAVIEGYKLSVTVADPALVIEFAASGANGNLAGGTNTPASFDSRDNPPGTGNNGAAAVLSQSTNIGQGNHVIYESLNLGANVQSNESINFEAQEIPLLPGADWEVRSSVVNLGLTVSVRWRERFLEEQERS